MSRFLFLISVQTFSAVSLKTLCIANLIVPFSYNANLAKFSFISFYDTLERAFEGVQVYYMPTESTNLMFRKKTLDIQY